MEEDLNQAPAPFGFNLNQQVSLALSGEQGCVIGIANYVDGGTQYQVRYVTRGGEQREQWIGLSGLLAQATEG